MIESKNLSKSYSSGVDTLHPAPVAMSALWQIGAMWLYETKLHWRRRPLMVMFLTLVITTVISNLIILSGLSQSSMRLADVTGMELERALLVKGMFLMSISMSVLSFAQMLIIPFILSDSVAQDESSHMKELLQSTSLPGWAYLVGKIGGVWWAGMSAITLAMIIVCIASFLTIGAYNPIPMLDSWIALSAPVLLFNAGFAVLIGATQPTRPRAVLIVLGGFFLSGYLGGLGADSPMSALNPFNGSMVILIFGQNDIQPGVYAPVFTMPGVMDFIIGRGLVFLITALIVGTWWTLRWSDVSLWPKTTTTPAPLPVQQGS